MTFRPARLAAIPILAALAAFSPGADAQDARRKQEILFDEIPAHTVGDAPFDIVVKTTSGLPVVLGVVSGPAVLDGKKLKLTGTPGLIVLRASQKGDAVFLPARDTVRAFGVDPRPSAPVVHSQPMGANVAVGEPLILAVEVSGEPEPALQWRKDGEPITGAGSRRFSIVQAAFSDSGTYDVIASNSSGVARSAAARVVVGKRHQMISFQAVPSAIAGQSISLNASASSGLPVRFDIISGVGILSGQSLTSQGGSVVVQASQPGDATYEAANQVTQTILFSSVPNQQVP